MDKPALGKGGHVGPRGRTDTKGRGRQGGGVQFVAKDEAKIRASSRKTAAAIENLVQRARQDGGDRADVVAAALQKLQSGALDQESVYGATAQQLLDAKFGSG